MNSRQAAALEMEPNPLQKALENYQELERQWHETRSVNDDLRANNAALLSEVGMLRDLLMAADADRVRWQATAATLLGRWQRPKHRRRRKPLLSLRRPLAARRCRRSILVARARPIADEADRTG
jgi:hypothetical protein